MDDYKENFAADRKASQAMARAAEEMRILGMERLVALMDDYRDREYMEMAMAANLAKAVVDKVGAVSAGAANAAKARDRLLREAQEEMRLVGKPRRLRAGLRRVAERLHLPMGAAKQ